MSLPRLISIAQALLIAGFILMFSSLATGQQVTYYTFNGATAAGQSGTCVSPNVSTNPLLCLNGSVSAGFSNTGQNTFPVVTYPANLDPGTNAMHQYNELLLNAENGGNGESAWFSHAQKITDGFTNYFAFRMVPGAASADGIAFVIQNAAGGAGTGVGPNTGTLCGEFGSGVTVLGSSGGCMGYGGIDNSLAIEFDTFHNDNDPSGDANPSPGGSSHIAIQSCGTANNSPSHNTGGCKIALYNNLPFALSGTGAHEVVVEYSGEPTNLLQVYIDPPFISGTHTPCTDSIECETVATPVLSITYDIKANLSLLDTGNGPDSAYVGFTSATGSDYESHELFAWTYTAHQPVTQQQPISNPGAPTVFPFGDHTAAVQYPADAPTPPATDMIMTANTISQTDFTQLILGTSFTGSVCQIYEGTGGNCIIYSVHCVTHGTTTKVPCPSTTDPTIAVKTAYESDDSITPTSPGFLQGDPLYSQIDSITANGTTATVTCTGECAVTDGEHVSIRNNSTSGLNVENVVASVPVQDPPVVDSFTYSTTFNGSGTGGFVTSNNLVNICNPIVSDDPNVPPCWQAKRIDATSTGTTKHFSDLTALFQTVNTVGTTTTITAPPIFFGDSAVIAVSVTPNSGSGPVTGAVTLTVDGNPLPAQNLVDGSTIFTVPGLNAASHPLNASYAANDIFMASSTTGAEVVNPAAPTVTFTGAPASAAFGATFAVSATTNASTIAMITAGGACSNVGNSITMTSGTGTCNLTATWAPDANYSGATLTQSTTATKVTPTVTFTGAPVSAVFGTGFNVASTTTGAAAAMIGSGGACSNSGNAVTMISGTGTCALTATWAADANYNGATLTQTTMAVKAPLTISWTPASIQLGFPLGAAQLNATISPNVPGSFAYTPPSGTAVTLGQTVMAQFNPAAPANYTSPTKTVALTVTAGAVAMVSPPSIDFGTLYLGSIVTKNVTVTNTGNAALAVTGPILSLVRGGDSNEFIEVNLCPKSLAAGKNCTITIAFIAGPFYTQQTATLNVMDNAPGSPQSVTLTAMVKNPQASLNKSLLSFGTQKVGTPTAAQTVTIKNTGATTLTINSIAVTGSNKGDFPLQSNSCGSTLTAGSSCTVGVAFSPTAKNARSATLTIQDDAFNSPQTVSLTGTGK